MAKSFRLILYLCLFASISLSAQQEGHYTMYMLNPFAYNPGFAGMDNSLSATGVFRRQWVDLDFTPISQQINVHAPVGSLRGAVGLNFDNDEYGAETRTRFGLGYAFHQELGQGILSIAARANIMQRTLDGSRIRTPEGNYFGVGVDHNDPILPNTNESGSAPSFDIGLYYKNERWEAGLGISNLTESSIELTSLSLINSRTLAFNAGVNLDVLYNLRLKPALFVQSDLTQTQVAVSVMAEYNESYALGASYRGPSANSRDAVAIIGLINLGPNLKLGYSYDITLSGLRQVNSGTHEILLNYNLNTGRIFTPKPNTIYNPRDF